MPPASEHPFDIKPVIENRPFTNPAVRGFFDAWCKANTAIEPVIVSREEWEKEKTSGIIKYENEGGKTLFLPEDISLPEMIEVVHAIDRNTFRGGPRSEEASRKLENLGRLFRNSGVYLRQKLSVINEGREAAEKLAEDLYSYGQELLSEKNALLSDSVITPLSPHDIEELKDLWKLNDTKNKTSDEVLAQVFRAADTAHRLSQKEESNPLSVHENFLEEKESALNAEIEAPDQEVKAAIFRQGLNRLIEEMREGDRPESAVVRFFKAIGISFKKEKQTIRDAIKIDDLRHELLDLKKSGNIEGIVEKEREIANIIQEATSHLTYNADKSLPSEILETETINCVGASAIGGMFMNEAGLTYLVGGVPAHSILLLVTADGKVEWRDMLASQHNEELTDEKIIGLKKDGNALTEKDLADFALHPNDEGLFFDTTHQMPWVGDKERHFLNVFGAEQGQRLQVLNNIGVNLNNSGKTEEAIEAFRYATKNNPKYPYLWNGLGTALINTGDFVEAEKSLNRALEINVSYIDPYINLGMLSIKKHKFDQAEKWIKKALEISPHDERALQALETLKKKQNKDA